VPEPSDCDEDDGIVAIQSKSTSSCLGPYEATSPIGEGCVCSPGYERNNGLCVVICTAQGRVRLADGSCPCASTHEEVKTNTGDSACVLKCAENERQIASDQCACVVGFSKFNDVCIPDCKGGRIRTERDPECRCPQGYAEVSGECQPQPQCGPHSELLGNKCKCNEGFRLASDGSGCNQIFIGGTCGAVNEEHLHTYGKYRPASEMCPFAATCEPTDTGFDCMTASEKKSLLDKRCGTCGFSSSGGACHRYNGWCKQGFYCAEERGNFNCIPNAGVSKSDADCGECGQVVFEDRFRDGLDRCRKRFLYTLGSSADTEKNFCASRQGFVCSARMIDGKFPCVDPQSVVRPRADPTSTRMNICSWSDERERQTLYVTASEEKATNFKPPKKFIFMRYDFGVYVGTEEVSGSEGGWIYDHRRSGNNMTYISPSRSPRRSVVPGYTDFYAWGFPRIFASPNVGKQTAATYWSNEVQV
jgi:hypothetical protein